MLAYRRYFACFLFTAFVVACTDARPTPEQEEETLAIKDLEAFAIAENFESDGRPVIKLANGTTVQLIRPEEFTETEKRFPVLPEEIDPEYDLKLQNQAERIVSSVDLRAFQTGIRNQNPRGTCIVFANIAAIEAAYKRTYGLDLDLSEQYLNHIRRTVFLPSSPTEGSIPRMLPRAETLPGMWGWGGAYDEQITYMRHGGGIPLETDMPYQAPSLSYEDTSQSGDNPQAFWQRYYDGHVTQQLIDAYNLNHNSATYAIPASQTQTSLPLAALRNARYRATLWYRARPTDLNTVNWFRFQLSRNREVVFSVNLTSNPPSTQAGIWRPGTGNVGGHVMLMVGFNDKQRFFYVKNSWGEGNIRRLSYDWVTTGLVNAAHVVAGIAPPGLTTPQLYLGTWKLKSATVNGNLHIYHPTGMYGTINGIADTRLGTFFRDDGRVFRVNAQISQRNITFFYQPQTPDLTYDAPAGIGSVLFTGSLETTDRRISGTFNTVGSNNQAVSFNAVRDITNLVPRVFVYGAYANLKTNTSYTFGAIGEDLDGGADFGVSKIPCSQITWRSAFGVQLSSTTGCEINATFTQGGSYQVFATVTDADGATRENGTIATLVTAAQAVQPRAYLNLPNPDALNYRTDTELMVNYEAYSGQQADVTTRMFLEIDGVFSADIPPSQGQYRFVPNQYLTFAQATCSREPGVIATINLIVRDSSSGAESRYYRYVRFVCPPN